MTKFTNGDLLSVNISVDLELFGLDRAVPKAELEHLFLKHVMEVLEIEWELPYSLCHGVGIDIKKRDVKKTVIDEEYLRPPEDK